MAVRSVERETESQTARLLSLEEFRAQLQATGEERYHHKHPFHQMMHEGKLTRGQLHFRAGQAAPEPRRCRVDSS